MNNIEYRELTIDDLKEFKRLRLELLKNEPTNFGSSYEEELQFEDIMWTNRLSKETVITYGAFIENKLVGMSLGVMSPRKKMKHAATINSVYVSKEQRGNNIGMTLMINLIDVLKKKKIEAIKLSVVSTNQPAVRLYTKLGFIHYGTEDYSIKYNNEYISQYLMIKKL